MDPEEVEAEVPLADMAGYRLIKLGELALERADEALAPLGLSAREYNVLATVAAEAGRSQQALSALIGINPTVMVAIVDRLEEQGLVERRRDPSDRRRHALAATTQGQTTVRTGARSLAEAEKRLLVALATEERQQLARLTALALASLWPPPVPRPEE